jgi:hypothetical protein
MPGEIGMGRAKEVALDVWLVTHIQLALTTTRSSTSFA